MNLNSCAKLLLPTALYQKIAGSSVAKRLASGSFWGLLSALIVKGSAFLQGIVLARILGIAGFGEWGIVLSTIAVVSVFGGFGLGNTATKYVSEWRATNPGRLGDLLGLLLAIAIIISAVVFLVLSIFSSRIASDILAAPHLKSALTLIAINVFTNAVTGVFQGILAGFEKFYLTTKIQTTTTLISAALSIFLSVSFGLHGAIIGLTIGGAIALIIFFVYTFALLRIENINIKFNTIHRECSSLMSMSLPLTLSSLLAIPATWAANVILIQQAGGYEQMGGFQAANQWRTIVVFLPQQIMAAYLPVLSSLLSEPNNSIDVIQKRVILLVLIAGILIAAPVTLLSPWLIDLYGNKFRGFYLALSIMAVKGILEALSAVLKRTVMALGQPWLLLISEGTFLLVVIIVGTTWLIPNYLATGMAVTFLLAQTAQFLVQYVVTAYAIKRVTA